MRRDLVQRAMAHDHEAFSELARLSIDKHYAVALAGNLPHEVPTSTPGLTYRAGASQTALQDGRALVAGGWSACESEEQASIAALGVCSIHPIGTAGLSHPSTGASVPLAPLSQPRAEHTATLLPDGRVLIVGSHAHSELDATAEVCQPIGAP